MGRRRARLGVFRLSAGHAATSRSKSRWPLRTTIGTLLAGTIPLLGIILEHFRTKQVKQQFNLRARSAGTSCASARPRCDIASFSPE